MKLIKRGAVGDGARLSLRWDRISLPKREREGANAPGLEPTRSMAITTAFLGNRVHQSDYGDDERRIFITSAQKKAGRLEKKKEPS